MSSTEPFDTDDDLEERIDAAVQEANEHQGFDAFWAEQLRREAAERGAAPTEVIRGITVRIPQDLPMRFRAKARAMQDEEGDDAFKELLADLFGVDVLDAWSEAGMGGREFRVVLAWGLSHGDGNPITWQQAYDQVMAKGQDGDEGKAGSSTRKSGGSGGSGRSSKPTSAGSTSSRRKR